MAVKVTEEFKREIHAAMEKAGGKTAEAARILRISTEELSRHIHHHNDLKLRWATSYKEVKAPGEAIVVHRDLAVSHHLAVSEYEMAAAIEKEDALVRKGLDAAGINSEGRDMAMALASLQKRHFQTCIEMLGGGITKQFLEVMAEVKKISERLNDPTDECASDVEIQLMLREDRGRLLECLQRFYDRANQAVLTQAKIRALKKAKAAEDGRAKPGFSPLVIKAEGNVSITEAKQIEN